MSTPGGGRATYGRRKLLATLTILLLIAVYAAQAAVIERRVMGGFLAVTYNNVGRVIDVELWVRTPGSDIFVYEPVGGVGEDTVLSARVGLFYAALLNRVDPRSIDAGFKILDQEEVSGASAGLAFTALYYALIHGLGVDTERVSFTGLIQPNGMVAAVGGLTAKLRAAAMHGYRVVYAPLERLNTSIPVGVSVVQVCSFAEVLRGVYGYTPLRPERLNSTVFQPAALQMIKLLEYTVSLRINESRALKVALAALNESKNMYARGEYYAAASTAYSGIVGLLDVMPPSELRNFTLHVLGLVNRTVLAEKLVKLKLEWREARRYPLWRLEALLAADYRFYAASKLLSSNDPAKRALGALRLLTSQQWLEAAERLRGPLVDHDVAKHGLELLVAYADLSARYLESLVAGAKVVIENTEKLRLRELLDDMRSSYIKGDMLRAAAIALDILMLVDRAITHYDVTMGAQPRKLVECAELQVGLAESVSGLKQLTSSLLLEYATAINSTFVSAVLASEAASAAILSLTLSVNSVPLAAHEEVQVNSNFAVITAVAVASAVLGGVGVAAFAALSKKIE